MSNPFYSHPEIRWRIREFVGHTAGGRPGAMYLALGDAGHPHHREPRPPEDLEDAFAAGSEISRSLWDRESLVGHLDLEWVNFDNAAAAYEAPEHCFRAQEAVAASVASTLNDCGIHALHLLTGRGHHFIWSIAPDSAAFHHLQSLGVGWMTPTLQALYASPRPPEGETVPALMGAAYAGLGLVLEYVAFEAKRAAAPLTPIPVEITAVEVGPGPLGREMVSIDISEYGDPLSARTIRAPFSVYLKPWQAGVAFAANEPFVLLPLAEGMDWPEALAIRGDPEHVAALANRVSTRIPEAAEGTARLINRYLKSAVARYHEWHLAEPAEKNGPWSDPPEPPADLPACGQFLLGHPNDLLLKPSGAARVTRLLLSLGWHPRRIVDLIRARYEQDFGWGDAWTGYDPGTRAEFFVRIFAGQFCTGVDDLVDFNCKSAQEQAVCCIPGCRNNLARYQQSLLNRRRYERLARRPFHRLFLPEEHL